MKKALFLILVAVLCITSIAAATSTKFNKYANTFKSGEYTVKGTFYEINSSGNKTGNASPVTIAMHAGQYYMEITADGENAKMLLKDGKLYIIADSEKMVMILPGDDEQAESLVQIPSTFDYSKSGSGRFDGKSLYYETLNDSRTSESTYWYNGSDLYAIQIKDDVSNSAIFIDSITQRADSSLFNIPSSYEVMDLSEMASWFSDYDSSNSYDVSSSSEEDWASALAGIDWESLFADTDWSSSSGDYSDWGYTNDYEPHYYALALAMGLSSAQAKAFEESMNSLSNIDWLELNYYYDSSTDKYELNGTSISDAAYLSSYDMDKLNSLMKKFK